MRVFRAGERDFWLSMIEPPWRDNKNPDMHWITWLVGWAWALSGLVLGALVAPTLVQATRLANASYRDWLVIAIAVVAGVLVQVLGVAFFIIFFGTITYLLTNADPKVAKMPSLIQTLLSFLVVVVVVVGAPIVLLLPIAGVGYGIYRYLTWVGADQPIVTIAFVGGLLVKTFLIPLIKGIVTGALFKWFMHWLRGGKKQEG